jgi:DNA invertase Pin-like site-specific DNA recombinase
MSDEPVTLAQNGRVRAAEYLRMSTDHQKYSIANQSALIHTYANANGLQIVQSYADPGRSGLTLKDRPGLSRLLADVVSGGAKFEAVLVYDVSRWGRFQDTDESAHYEFLCRRAGVRVIYCAEQFASDGTPFASVLKSLKRAMAGEFSRELSVKVAAGKARIGRMGFRIGGIAGYGLRRQLLEDGQRPGMVLREHQRKSLQTDRVKLVPGPPEEIRVVRRIYRDYIYLRKSERQISVDLNADGINCLGGRWSRALVRTILSNEKYVGNHIVGKFSQRMRMPLIINAPEKWIRCDGAFQPIVPREVFDAAAQVRRFNERTYLSPEELLKALAVVLRREGKLTAAIINQAPELPSANTVELRFGSLVQAYERLGYKLPAQYAHHAVNRALLTFKKRAEEELLRALLELGVTCSCTDEGLISVASLCTVEVRCCRFQQPSKWHAGWRIAYARTLEASKVVALRMNSGNETIRDVLVVPRAELARLPVFLQPRHEVLLGLYRYPTVGAAAHALCGRADA